MRKLLIIIDNFYPAYRGGGPIQSISNLILFLSEKYSIYVITSAYDLQSQGIMRGIKPDEWNKITLPGSDKTIVTWYAGKHKPSYYSMKNLLQQIQPDCIYLNGIFSYNFFIIPLMALKNLQLNAKIIICPRGMLQKGALANKKFKKIIYLKILKSTGLVKQAKWHATNNEEREDILKYFDINRQVVIAGNIPKMPIETINYIQKDPGNLKLIYLSLVTEKKNLLFLLEILKSSENITLDIFGPVKDAKHWSQCKILIDQMPDKVKYCGDVVPIKVQSLLANYHALILLTKGENFGHALYESLSVGRPIITSNYTPWENLKNENAGWNVSITDKVECVSVLFNFTEMVNEDYIKLCKGSHDLAKNYYDSIEGKITYEKLFN